MPAESTARPKRPGRGSDTATVLPFPLRVEVALDPANALDRIISSLTREQAQALAPEIEILTRALSAETIPSRPTNAPEGLRPRHSRSCRTKHGGACNCEPSWEASVYAKTEKRKVRETFSTKQAAISWRRKKLGLVDSGQLRTPSRLTVADTGEAWVAMAQAGEILNRSGKRYKPAALRTIEQDLRLRVIPALGAHSMSELARADFQRLVGTWLAEELSASRIHGTITSAQLLWRDFDLITGADNLLPNSPASGLRLPAVRGRRERIATPDEAHRLIEALEEQDQALWATATYAGVRHGELRALRAENIDFEHKRIKILKGWDDIEGEIDPKSEKGKRSTVISRLLHELLAAHLERSGRTGSDLVFGRTPTSPFNTNTINNRARRAWAAARQREDEENLVPVDQRIRAIGLHECRHTAVSHMLDAGITIDKVSKFMGHSSITVTIDRYSHLLPGGEAEAAGLLDEYHGRR